MQALNRAAMNKQTSGLINKRKIIRMEGFTLLEIIIAITIAAATTTWALPNLQRTIRQSSVDNYTKNFEQGIFSLIAEVRKSSKSCILFESKGQRSVYTDPSNLVELSGLSTSHEDTNSDELRAKYLNCSDTENATSSQKFRYLARENSSESKNVEVMTTKINYEISPQGTNPQGEDIIFRVRSKDWQRNRQLMSRCLVISGNGHLFKGTWQYSGIEGCRYKCPPGENCNG